MQLIKYTDSSLMQRLKRIKEKACRMLMMTIDRMMESLQAVHTQCISSRHGFLP